MDHAVHHLENSRTLRQAQADPLHFLQTLAGSGDAAPFTVGKRHALLLNHPRHIEQVLVSQHERFVKGPAFTRARRLLGNGLLTAEGAFHRQRRRIVQPAFHRTLMDRHAELMVQRSAALSDRWLAGSTVDLIEEMQKLTLAIMTQALLGTDIDERDAADLRRAISEVAAGDPLASLLAPPRRTRAARERLHAIAARMIERRLASDASGEDLFALLLSAQPVSDAEAAKQLHDDVLTFLAAGYDTIANTLTWSWLMLSQHPDVEDALHGELAEVLDGRLPTADDAPRLIYTRAVLAECLRLFPAAWMLTRVAVADCALDTDTIRAGTLVVMSPYLVHRDPRFFAEPLAFDPGRWLSTERPTRPKLAYFPFGAGPRSCIGEGFALMEGTLALAVLAQRWRLRAIGPPGAIVDARVTLRPMPPVMARVEARP